MRLITRKVEQADWQQVKRLVQEDMLHVGDQVEDFIRSTPMTFEVAEVLNEGVYFVSKQLWPEIVQWNKERTNKGGFKDSNVKRFLNEEIYNILPDEMQEVISERQVLQIIDGVEERFPCKLWLPTEYEVFGEEAWVNDDHEGQQFTYFKDPSNRVKCDDETGESEFWWLASVYSGNSTTACYVNDHGNASYTGTSYSLRVPICFLIAKESKE
ncbi:MAG: hypothetical protein J6M44_11010 [Butyrivibrio sp.]|nr:hypothetical protein [Butyrivibrio sp.]